MASNNSVQILIEAKDNASRVLSSTADNFKNVAGNFKASGDALSTAGDSMQRSTDSANGSLLKTGAIMGAVAGVASTALTSALNLVRDSIGDAVSRVDTLNNFPRVMANFGVSASDASKMISTLDKGVRGLPTTLNGIVTLAEGFVPLTKNTDEATQTALALNNAILAGGTPMYVQANAMEQFRQALSKGVPDLQDWKSLETAMPAQLQQTAEKLGIGTGALAGYTTNGLGLYKAMKDGKLSMDDFNQALVALNQNGINGLPNFAQQAKNATSGIATGFTNMKTSVTRGIGDMIQAIGTSNISDAMKNVGSGFESAAQGGASFIRSMTSVANFLMSHETMTFAAVSGLGALKVAMNFESISARFTAAIRPLTSALDTISTKGIAARTAFVEAGGAISGLRAAISTLAFNPLILGITLAAAAAGAIITQFLRVQGSSDQVKSSLDRQKDAHNKLALAEQNASEDESNLAKAKFDLEGANLAVEQAQNDYNTAVANFGPNSLEARSALHDLQSAQQIASDSAAAVSKQTDAATNSQKKLVEQKAATKQTLDDIAGAASNTASSYGNLASQIQSATDKASKMPSGPAKQGAQINAAFGFKPNGHASGTSFANTSTYLAGENGPELITGAQGSRVYNSDDTQRMLQKSGGTTISIQFNAPVNMRSDQDVQSLADKINQSARLNRLGMAS